MMDVDHGKIVGGAALAARTARGWSQAEAAEAIGVSTEHYGKIERGSALPSYRTMQRMVQDLAVSPAALFGQKHGRGDDAPISPRAVPGGLRPSDVRLFASLKPSDARLVRGLMTHLSRIRRSHPNGRGGNGRSEGGEFDSERDLREQSKN
jgi:transcriptional regulator with XRE-family HTH domain